MTQLTEVDELKSNVLKIVDTFATFIDSVIDNPPEATLGTVYLMGSEWLKVIYGDITGTVHVIPTIKELRQSQPDADLNGLNSEFFQHSCTRLIQMGISVTSDYACYIAEHAQEAGIDDPYVLVSVDLSATKDPAKQKELLHVCALLTVEVALMWLQHTSK